MSRPARVLFYAGPLLAWMILIFGASTRAGGSGVSTTLLTRWLARIDPRFLASLNPYQLYCLNYAFRKTGHVSEYAILALLAVRSFQAGRPSLDWRAWLGGGLLSVLYAATDEFHQIFVPGRTPAVEDVLIDSLGVLLSLAAMLLFFGLKRMERRLLACSNRESALG